jgi:hypothetical protein
MDADEFRSLYPDFQLEDELLEKGGRCHALRALCQTTRHEESRSKGGEASAGTERIQTEQRQCHLDRPDS